MEKDAANRLVSSISIVLNPTTNAMLSDADGVFLVTDTEGLLWIEMVHHNQKQKVSIPKNEIFDYELMGVCWGENYYGKTIVETFNDSGRCPEGTVRNVRKLDELPSFLKL